jgi:hypothetical protein
MNFWAKSMATCRCILSLHRLFVQVRKTMGLVGFVQEKFNENKKKCTFLHTKITKLKKYLQKLFSNSTLTNSS